MAEARAGLLQQRTVTGHVAAAAADALYMAFGEMAVQGDMALGETAVQDDLALGETAMQDDLARVAARFRGCRRVAR